MTDLHIHDLRHLGPSILLAEGVPDSIVAKVTGHRSAALRRYQHLSQSFRHQTVDLSTLGGNEGSIPTLVMKQLLGHSRLSTTDRYMHELAGPKREAVQKIENLILFPHKKVSGERNL